MFSKLGDFIVRAWPGVLITWVVAVVCASIAAPDLQTVAETQEFAFLPADSQSLVAEKLFRNAFPSNYCPSRIVIIASRSEGLTEADKDFLDDNVDENGLPIAHEARQYELCERLHEIQRLDTESTVPPNKPIISLIRSFRHPYAGPLLLNPQNTAALTIVELTTEFLDGRNRDPVGAIEDLLKDPEFLKLKPEGLNLALSGEATVGRDMIDAAKNSAKATEWLTLILVIVLLIIIYRAPLMAIIPLLTVIISVKFSMSLLILFAVQKWVKLFQGIEVYVAVLVYGAGVDYCLFLIARYKEEIDSGVSYDEATGNCIAKVGEAIAASAGTVICGIGMMMFAEFGKFRDAGFAISFGLTIVLIASLTFTPAILRLAGKWAFWPQLRTERVSGGWISSTSLLSRLSELHWLQNTWEIVGRFLLKKPLTIWLICMGLMLPFALIGVLRFSHLSYGLLSDLHNSAPSVVGTHVVSHYFPAGATGSINVLLKNEKVDFNDEKTGFAWIDELTQSLYDHSKDLKLAAIRSASFPIDARMLDLPAGVKRKAALKKSKEYYVSNVSDQALSSHVTRMEVTAEVDPFSRDSMRHLNILQDEIRRLLPEELRDGTQILVSGSAASIRDLKAVTDRDQVNVDMYSVAAVSLILWLLLRNFSLCAYLIVTVLFSYLVALGATYGFFWMTEPNFAGLDWKVPMFLFTILIAVGEDYNIFLMTRIQEEQQTHGPVKGVIEALSKTGRIISSCGIIMAGTFASLCGGSLKGMIQLGFALAFGVLLDTFVVRPVLVPAYLVLLHSGRFGKLGTWLGGPRVKQDPDAPLETSRVNS